MLSEPGARKALYLAHLEVTEGILLSAPLLLPEAAAEMGHLVAAALTADLAAERRTEPDSEDRGSTVRAVAEGTAQRAVRAVAVALVELAATHQPDWAVMVAPAGQSALPGRPCSTAAAAVVVGGQVPAPALAAAAASEVAGTAHPMPEMAATAQTVWAEVEAAWLVMALPPCVSAATAAPALSSSATKSPAQLISRRSHDLSHSITLPPAANR